MKFLTSIRITKSSGNLRAEAQRIWDENLSKYHDHDTHLTGPPPTKAAVRRQSFFDTQGKHEVDNISIDPGVNIGKAVF